MSYRRILLGAVTIFIAYLLFIVVTSENPTISGAIWPLVVALLVVLMLPEKRLQGAAIVDLVKAFKAGST